MRQRANVVEKTVIDTHERVIKERKSMYQNVFCCEGGNKILDDLVNFTGYNHVAYRPGCSTNDMIFIEGQRAVMKYILDQLDYVVKYDKKSEPSA